MVGLPQLLPHAAGLALLRGVEVLSGILENPKKPVVVILGGTKEDKLEVVPQLSIWADYVLIGGKLPLFVPSHPVLQSSNYPKIQVATLNPEAKDITLETVEQFGEIIEKAGTIVWVGPMGRYEGELSREAGSGFARGTREIGKIVVDSKAYTIIGGGDTEAALTKFGLVDKIDFVSAGGGAMLEFLANGDLPGLAALRN